MEKNIKELLQDMGFRPIGLDDEFRFRCTRCGRCCIHREDILLSPQDIFRMAGELGMEAGEFMADYCEAYIGKDSRFPIARLMPRGSVRRCPLLKDRKCRVHAAKPSVCAMFPVGRCIVMRGPGEEEAGSGIQYVLNLTSCGERSETHTVREWLQSFGIPLEDRFFLKWQEVVYEAGEAFRRAEIRADAREMETFWQAATMMLYLSYDMEKEFLPQFEANAQRLLEMLRKAVPQG